MVRQKEFQDLFQFNDSLLINGFIWARLSNNTFNKATEDLTEIPSPIYYGIKEIPLIFSEIAPVSFSSAYDLTMRLRDSLTKKMTKSKEEVKQEVESPIQKIEEVETLGWIEKRVKTAFMSINKISPSDLYWKEEDSKKFGKYVLLHVQSKQNKLLCQKCGTILTIKCDSHPQAPRIHPNTVQLIASFHNFALEKLAGGSFPETCELVKNHAEEVIKERLNRPPSSEDLEKLIEGEILLIGERLGNAYSQKFNKALYKKWQKIKKRR